DSIAESPLIEGRVAGIAVAVVRGADTLLMKSYGKGDLEWNAPLTDDAVFEIGSVTKQFTAAAILQLRDEGKIDLDADMAQYLPDFDTQDRRIPVRRLLDHTSGIRGITEMEEFASIVMESLPRDTLLDLVAAKPFDFEPGEALIYNNSAYILLGHIIEKVTGTSYEDYVEQQLFAPLGMHRSSYCSNTDVVPRRAHGYSLTPQGLVRASYNNHTWPFSAGSLCSTTGDLITWLRKLHGGEVLPEASYRDMITPGTLNDGTAVRYAMGVGVSPDPRGRASIGHGGGISGFVSDTRYYPEEDLYVVVLVNTTGNLSPAAIALEMVDVLLPPQPMARRAFEGDVAPLVGEYTGPTRGRISTATVTATANGLALSMNGGNAAPLSWVDDWTFSAGTRIVTFEREGNSGPATFVRIDGGGSHYVMRRTGG
ncbi:MAG TPA: serine hydrolase domain-containing protein, partial [Longimicrobiales bacterium]|nr:serine hydrolase domain-containing protein [Longimicrobiales bacterium]